MSRPDEPPADQRRLQELLEVWFTRVEAGEHPNVEEVCKDAPELEPILRRMVEQESDVTDALSVLAPIRGEERSLGVEVLGDFRILSFLGSGGMGQVHLARQESLGGRLVALKVLHATASQDERSVQRFRREAEIAAALDHPNIVPVYAVGENEGYAYLAMKWLSGPALDQLTEPLAARECARIGVAIARALHEAHESGVVHRDVKPGNVMLDGATPYVLDFGLARARADVTVTRQGTVPGTLPYMSPEQLRAGTSRSTLDARTDIYSLGATLYEIVSGRCPFLGDDPEVMIREILFNDPPALRLSAAHRDFETIVMRAMDKDRDRRFASAGDMADDLERYLAGMPVVSRPTGPMTRIVKKVRRHKQASLWIGGLLIGSMVLATVLTLNWFEQQRARDVAADEVAEILDQSRFAEATRMLASAEKRYGAFERFDVLAHRIDLGRRLEDLVDRLLEGGELKFIEAVTRELEKRLLVGGFGDETRERRWQLVQGITALRRRPIDDEGALYAVSGMSGRDVAAIRAFAHDESLDDLPAAGSRGVEEFVFTQVVLRAADRPRDDRLREIRAAERLPGGTGDDRVLYAYAVWLAEDVSKASEAEIAFRSLARDGEYRRSVLRNLMRQQIILGNLDDAQRSAALFLEQAPDRSRWSPEESAVIAELMIRTDRWNEAKAIVDAAFKGYPRNWTLLMAMHRVVARTDPAEALAHLELAEEVAHLRIQREQARGRALLMKLILAGDDQTRLEGLVDAAESFLLDARSPLARIDGLYAQGTGENRLERVRSATRLLFEAIKIDPGYIGPVNELASIAWARKDQALGKRMLPYLDLVLRSPQKGERQTPEVDLFAGLYLEAVLSCLANDWARARPLLADTMQIAESDDALASGLITPEVMNELGILYGHVLGKLK